MANAALKSSLAAAAGATAFGLVAIVHPAEAATLTYDFTVDLYSGASVSNASTNPVSYKGVFSFSFDESQPTDTAFDSCSSDFFCAHSYRHNLQVEFNFAGEIFTQQSDRDYGLKYPAVFFDKRSGALVGLSFIADPVAPNSSFAILGKEFYQGFAKTEYPDPQSEAKKQDPTIRARYQVGEVRYALRVPNPGPRPGEPSPCQLDPAACPTTAVPEPSEIAGSVAAIGVLGLVWRLRRRRTPLKP